MNDNTDPEGPRHAIALALLNDLAIILRNAERQGLERLDEKGEKVYDFGFWANQCDLVLGLRLLPR